MAERQPANLWLKLVLGIPLTVGFFWLYLWAGGGLGWVRGWALLGVMGVGETARTVYVSRKQPEMLRRRAELGEGTPRWDRLWLSGLGLIIAAVLLVGALDSRYGWAPLPGWTFVPGLLAYILYVVGFSWAMGQNPHFEKTVRIQHDRDHQVIDTGPYAIVRHPGYVAAMLGFGIAPPLLLGSAWALLPGLLLIPWLVLRTALEDRYLQEGLPGYAEYARRVPYRLIPGLW